MRLALRRDLNFDLDRYLNPFIPASRIDRLPRPVSRFLGYRDAPRAPIGNVPIALWSFLGGFCGTAILGGLFMADFIRDKGGPIIIGSYGAAAILEYNAIESPFSQPRNQVFGQFLSALIGVCITKLFAMSADFESLRWLAGALSVGLSSAAMALTGTIHPPAGATALLAAVEPAISGLGWFYLAIVLLSSVITLAVACLLNNLYRQYPLYWWSPHDKITRVRSGDEEKGDKAKGTDNETPTTAPANPHFDGSIVISARKGIIVPDDFYLADNERGVLEILAERLKEASNLGRGDAVRDSCSDTADSELSKTKSFGS